VTLEGKLPQLSVIQHQDAIAKLSQAAIVRGNNNHRTVSSTVGNKSVRNFVAVGRIKIPGRLVGQD
jgi:hypothetical protein